MVRWEMENWAKLQDAHRIAGLRGRHPQGISNREVLVRRLGSREEICVSQITGATDECRTKITMKWFSRGVKGLREQRTTTCSDVFVRERTHETNMVDCIWGIVDWKQRTTDDWWMKRARNSFSKRIKASESQPRTCFEVLDYEGSTKVMDCICCEEQQIIRDDE